MASTTDCKNILSSDPSTKAGKGWKRLSKRNAVDGVERIFSTADESLFARILENDSGLSIVGVGATRAAVDPSAAASAAPSSTQPHAVDNDPKRIALAQQVVDAIMDGEDVDGRDLKKAGVALANQCVFGLVVSDDVDGFMVSAFPRSFWEENGCCPDTEMPLSVLLPGDDAYSENETCDFTVTGFDTVRELADAMLAKGFVWEPNLQKLLDGAWGESPSPDARDTMKHLKNLYAPEPAPQVNTPTAAAPVAASTVWSNPTGFYVVSTREDLTRLAPKPEGAGLQVALLRMPPGDAGSYIVIADTMTVLSRSLPRRNTKIIGVAHNSPAWDEMDAHVGPGKPGDVVGFVPVRSDDASGRMALAPWSDIPERVVDVEGIVGGMFPQGVSSTPAPKRRGP